MSWIGFEYLDMDWKWGESLHIVRGGFKKSSNDVNMSVSGCERAENEWEWVKMSRSGWE